MNVHALLAFFVAVLTILNPIGNAALFAGMVSGRSETDRRAIILRCTLAVSVVLLVSVWVGEQLLTFFGVTLPSLQASGGLVIMLIALSMLHSSQSEIHSVTKGEKQEAPSDNIAFVPLTMPIIAGPGAIATVIVHTHQHQGVVSNLWMSAICVAAAMVVGVCMLAVEWIQGLIGKSGMDVVAKLMGLVLLAIAVSMIATGAKGLMPGLDSTQPVSHQHSSDS